MVQEMSGRDQSPSQYVCLCTDQVDQERQAVQGQCHRPQTEAGQQGLAGRCQDWDRRSERVVHTSMLEVHSLLVARLFTALVEDRLWLETKVHPRLTRACCRQGTYLAIT